MSAMTCISRDMTAPTGPGKEESMRTLMLRYGRYALSTLSSLGFGMTLQ